MDIKAEKIGKILGEALGMASLCWIPKPTGVFDSTKAVEILDKTVDEIFSCVESVKKPDSQKLLNKKIVEEIIRNEIVYKTVLEENSKNEITILILGYEKAAETICDTFGTPPPDALAAENKELREALRKIKDGEYDNAHDPKCAAMVAKQALGVKAEGE